MEEEVKCQHMADLAQADLVAAMPLLEAAMKVTIDDSRLQDPFN